MRPQISVWMVLLALVAACGDGDRSLELLEASGDGGMAGEEPEQRTASRVDPILEGRKYRIQTRNPFWFIDEELETFDVSFDGAPRRTPEVPLPLDFIPEGAATTASSLVALSCAYEMATSSEVIAPALDSHPNPGTYIRGGGGGEFPEPYGRPVPNWPLAPYQLWLWFLEQEEFANRCDPNTYWIQMMNLCVADRYLELANADSPYEIALKAVPSPRSKVPSDYDEMYQCNDETQTNLCSTITLTMQPVSALEASAEQRASALRQYLLWPVSRNLDLASSPPQFIDGFSSTWGKLPQRGSLTEAEYLDAIVPYYMKPVARFPVQDASDKATLALLAANYYLGAQDVAQWFFECQVGGTVLPDNMQWVDTYDQRSLRVNELVAAQMVEAMKGSVEAAETAQNWITAAANEKVAGNSSEEANQLFWREQTNSRLECVHAWTDLAPSLFQAPGATELDEDALYPVFPWTESDDEVLRVEGILRESRVNPSIILDGGVSELAEAMRASFHAQMPYGFADIDLSGSGLQVLAAMGIDQEDLRSAAHRIIDGNKALGRPTVTLDDAVTGVNESRPIEIPGEGASGYYFTYGTERSERPVEPAALFARSVGVGTDNAVPLPTGDDVYAYQGVVSGLAASERILQQVSERFGIVTSSGVVPLFAPASEALALTTADVASDADIVALTQTGIALANQWVPELVGICPNGLIYFLSDEQRTDVPTAWRGEAGLECATKGVFGDVTCNPDAFRIPYTTAPAPYLPGRDPGIGKFGLGGILNLAGVPAGERIYFTRDTPNGRKAIVGITMPSTCNYYSFGEALMQKVNECLAPSSIDPGAPAICCEGLPCDLQVPLEDSLQTTAPRDVESSFMHYLTLARAAATRADELGEQLFRQGLEMDMRAEGAREELEDLCGGVANVDRLAPQTCGSDAECGDGTVDGMTCMAASGLEGGTRYCTGGSLTDTLAYNSLTDCDDNADCNSGEICAIDGGVRVCAPACTMGCSGACVDSPNGSYCAAGCSSDADCGVGLACRDNGTGTSVCVAAPSDDLSSIEECLNLTEDNQLVPAAIGTKPLVAWRFPGLPACVCRTGADCTAYNPDTGMPNCPALNESELAIPMGAELYAIDATLGFNTGIGGQGGGGGPRSPLACGALAELRMPASDMTVEERQILVDQIMAQPWMKFAGFNEIGKHVDPEYDNYGFLTLNTKDGPWLATGSATSGPLTAAVFPNEPWAPEGPICEGEIRAGVPLQCRSFNGGGDEGLSNDDLARMTQIIKIFAGERRIPLAYRMIREVQDEDGVAPGGRYLIRDAEREPAPLWLRNAAGATAFLNKVTVQTTNPLFGVHQVGTELALENGSDQVGNDGTYIKQPVCLTGATGYWADLIGCEPTAATVNGWTVMARYKAFANGKLHNGLFARNDSDKGDQVIDGAKRMFARRDDKSLWNMLNIIATTSTPLDIDQPAPLETAGWNTRDVRGRTGAAGKITIGQMMDSLELMCLIASAPRGPQVGLQVGCNDELMGETPTISGPRDFPKLTTRLRCAADRVDSELERMWVPEMPSAIIKAISASTVTDTVPNYRGSYAQTIAQLQGAFQTVSESTRTIGSQLRAFANELALSQSTLEQIDNEGKILDWKLIADISAQVASCGESASSLSWGSAFTCANAAVQIASAVAIEGLQEKNLDESKKQALIQLSMQFNDRLDTIQAAAESLRKAYTDIAVLQAELEVTRNKAERAAAKMLFLDSDSTGRVYNVNTAMRRNMNTLRERYQDALVDAKRMSFIARRSIEQRLAMSLEDMDKDMSLVEAPSTWVNTACSMTGIDYDRIRNATTTPVAESPEDNFSAGFIGDYVTKLENFVESYRFEYPFRDGSDVAVVSLRDDILGVKAPCEVTGPNLLYSSTDVQPSAFDFAEVDSPMWQDFSDEGTFMTLSPTGGSPRAADTSSAEHTVAPRLPGGSAYVMAGTSTPEDPEARAYWGQEVFLEEGLYLVSWYERFGPNDDTCMTPPTQSWPFVETDVLTLGEDGSSLITSVPTMVPLTFGDEPNYAEEFIQSCWRRWVRQFVVEEAQTVRVRFGLQDDAVPTVWGQPQVELVGARDIGYDPELGTPETEAWPQPFFPTNEVLTAQLGECEDTTGEHFQMEMLSGASLCENVCPDGTGDACQQSGSAATFATQCYHELRFDIGPGALERGELIPSVARGNFNYRFSRFGVNLVGTGLRDCEQAEFPSSCYANGYVQYSLRHDGPFTVTNHDGGRSQVALFPANIEHAKALTAERYVTNPISSADRALMEDFWRSELRGRPMQGSYALRIYDEPGPSGQNALDITKLEDVQLVFEYNYWTRAEQ